MAIVEDKPDMLRLRMTDEQRVSGSGNNYATVAVMAEWAERAAFARTALAVKLRELQLVDAEIERLRAISHQLAEECRTLGVHCCEKDDHLELAIRGEIRRAR